jgi:N-acetylated-alpha-linked acidic dipeptidase
MSDAATLPLNTTHYSYELENYLDKYVHPLSRSRLKLALTICRVESIVASSSLDMDLSSLRQSIQSLQASSLELDAEKHKAEHELKKMIKKWRRRHSRRMEFRRHARKIACRIVKFFGLGSCKCHYHGRQPSVATVGGQLVRPRVGRLVGWLQEQRERKEGRLGYGYELVRYRTDLSLISTLHRYPSRRFIKAVKRVRAVNQKLVAFERGFISEGGIPEREWYRHLGVAPGKWLGKFLL